MTWRNRNLYLIGLPGAGKSAIGRELAALLKEHGYSFVDLDKEIERSAGATISDIFSTRGERTFRTFETEALLRVCATNGKGLIVATGGGIVLSPLNRAIIRGSGIPIWIDVTVRDAAKNVLADILQGHDRPLFRAKTPDELKERLRVLLDERRPFYEQATLHFVTRSPRGDERTPKELADELHTALDKMSLQGALKPPFRTIIAQSALGNYPVLLGSGCATRELIHIVIDGGYTNVIVVTDLNVANLYWESVQAVLKELGTKRNVHRTTLELGEQKKNQETLFELLNAFANAEATRRNTVVVALGGGVVTDITALAANLYHRGLPLVHIPTTLLAQVDAAIGGKTGIDAFGKKNALGTFFPPKQILIDPLFLKTLPKRELHAGLAEVFKYGLIGSRPLWNKLSKQVRRLVRGVDAAYEEVIVDCVREKLRYVGSDEFERAEGVRELLNFGHTFGHALEAATGFTALLHGEAVLLGMRTAAWLSKELGHLSEGDWTAIESTLGRIPIKGVIDTAAETVLSFFKRDKKGENRVILLHGIGEAFVTTITDDDARRAINYMLTLA